MPAVPSESIIDILQLSYSEGSVVTFSCMHPSELVTEDTLENLSPKEEVRYECRQGKWIGEKFRCAELEDFVDRIVIYNGNVVNEKTDLSQTKPKKILADNEFDDNDKCVKNLSSGILKRHSWVLDAEDTDVKSDLIRIEFETAIPEMLVDYESAPLQIYNENEECTLKYMNNVFMQFLCDNAKANANVTFVFSTKLSKLKTALKSICIYSFPSECGLPEIPLNSRVVKKLIKAGKDEDEEDEYNYVYECLKYFPEGRKQIECVDGQWSGEGLKCVPRVTCPLPENFDFIQENRVTLSNRTKDTIVYENAEKINGVLVAVPNTIASYLCRGLRSYYAGSRICNYRGIWEGAEPSCHKGIITTSVRLLKLPVIF
ncbi:hypothetical protein B4U80_13526 [Leptotrombidium deliense]|uniref:Sushi domain-containing protein n=1 Tax=Leptotrombidium deliense TaxID=299467 RepID=A0A443STZ2_9ACAR|nr:hypothetical protein B4U80_13526 [Leptotrombidium deliense]